jgi:hypothetical protein
MERVPLEKLLFTHLVKKVPTFMEPEGSLLCCSQKPATSPYSEPDALLRQTAVQQIWEYRDPNPFHCQYFRLPNINLGKEVGQFMQYEFN